jgi:hypothetical protein
MSATQLRSTLRWLVIATVMIVPLIFWRSVADAFDLVKGTMLALFGLAVLLTLGMLAALDRRHIAAKPTLIIAGVFSGAAVISTITSMDPLQSVIGQYQRYTGLVTLLAAVLVMISISATFDQKRLINLGQVLVITASGVALYGFLQQTGADPFQWTSESFGKFVFGTMGNPNTGTAFVSVVSPITAWAMLRKEHSQPVRVISGCNVWPCNGDDAGLSVVPRLCGLRVCDRVSGALGLVERSPIRPMDNRAVLCGAPWLFVPPGKFQLADLDGCSLCGGFHGARSTR